MRADHTRLTAYGVPTRPLRRLGGGTDPHEKVLAAEERCGGRNIPVKGVGDGVAPAVDLKWYIRRDMLG